MPVSIPSTLAGSQTGVFVGLTHGDYELLAAGSDAVEGPYGFTGTSNSLASGRIAYALGLHGPARHRGHRVLVRSDRRAPGLPQPARRRERPRARRRRRRDAGTAEVDRRIGCRACCRRPGRCHAFDVAADGFVSGEGCVVVLLKRLPDAVRDGDRILAVIRGTAANQDGRTVNIATPSEPAQVAVYRAALAAAGVDADHRRHGRGARHRHPGRRSDRVRQPGRGLRHRRSLRPRLGEDQLRASPVDLGTAGPDEGDPRAAARRGPAEPALQPAARRARRDRDRTLRAAGRSRRGPPTGTIRAAPRCRRTGMSGTNVHAILEQAPATRTGGPATAKPGRRRRWRAAAVSAVGHVGRGTARHRGPAGRLGRRAGSGRRRGARRIWPTPWRAGVRTGRCARRCPRAASPS